METSRHMTGKVLKASVFLGVIILTAALTVLVYPLTRSIQIAGIVQAKDTASGVITLRLLLDDTLNGIQAEQIHNYTAKGTEFRWTQRGDIVIAEVNRESNATIRSLHGQESYHLTPWRGGSGGGMGWEELSSRPTPVNFDILGKAVCIGPHTYIEPNTEWFGVVVHPGETISFKYSANASVAFRLLLSNSSDIIGFMSDTEDTSLLAEQSGPSFGGAFTATANGYLLFNFEPNNDGWAAVTFDGNRTLSSGSTLTRE